MDYIALITDHPPKLADAVALRLQCSIYKEGQARG
jgi:hypothetical protein